MTTPASTLHLFGGVATTAELLAAGHVRATIATGVRSGAIHRLRKGWYGHADLHPEVRAAVRVGGRLSCVSTIAMRGGWAPEASALHVALAPNACRPRTPRDSRLRLTPTHPGVVLHWTATTATRGLATVWEAIDDVRSCVPADLAAASVSMLLRADASLRRQWTALPTPPIAELDTVCESGVEVLWWVRMRRHRLRIRRQVTIPGIGRVDFVIGTRLVVEVDGASYHTDPVAFEADRRRDARLSARGYRVLRFSYRQVLDRWAEVEAAVLAAVIRGDAA